MPRKQPELRKQELIDIASRQFMIQGYEKTSIRSIVGEANGEIGMFYHHFASKQEIFEAVLEQYNTEYIKKMKNLIDGKKEGSFSDLFEQILSTLEGSLSEYATMNTDTANTQMLTIIHHKTLILLLPIICDLISEYDTRGEINPPETETYLLAEFLLFGISAIIHDKGVKSMAAKKEAINALSYRLLGIKTMR